MRNQDCVGFLQWCLPGLGLRWRGFRKVRGTVCKRVARRMRDLGLADVAGYRAFLATHPAEWARLDAMCRIPISRFWRDRGVFDELASNTLPALAANARERGDSVVRAWSAGCASGEEPYSLRLAWSLCAEPAFPDVRIDIVATDIDETLLARARRGLYRPSSLRDLPLGLVDKAFRRSGGLFQLRPELRRDIAFLRQDIRTEAPDGKFDLALWRNLVFTYFDAPTQSRLFDSLRPHMRPGARLVIGAHEGLPEAASGVAACRGAPPICRLSGMRRPPRSD
ncbi:MAG: CheR family methyltransferase [Alphaproteobacteria bacterium]